MASEMLYPIVPVYLKELGFSVLLIGILEGVAEFTAGFTKGYFGKRSDEKGLRLPFVKAGYFLSALSKPMMAVFTWPFWIFSARTMDRLGKGLRTAARDALLSQQATPQTKGRVFAFHRGMDTMGAVAGPLLALAYLYHYPNQYATLFYIAFIPGLISVALIFLLKEERQPVSTVGKGHFFSFLRYWKIANPEYKKLVAGLLIFTLFNSSDVFLLLKTKAITGNDTTTIAAYIFYNLVYAMASYPMGMLADKLGMRKVFTAGLLVFSAVYFLFAYVPSTYGIFAAFLLYGLYAAATEGIAKAWISNLAHRENTATALGFYASSQSIMTFLASSLTGLIWVAAGDQTPFLVTGTGSLLLFFYFCLGRFRS